jgi:hypothetical protein
MSSERNFRDIDEFEGDGGGIENALITNPLRTSSLGVYMHRWR